MQESCIKQIIFRIGISSRWDSHIANEKRIKNSLFVCVRYPAPCFSLSLAPPAPTTWGALFSAFRSVFTFSIIFGFFVSAGRARPTRLKICLMLVSFVPAFCFFYYPLALSYFGHRFWGFFFHHCPPSFVIVSGVSEIIISPGRLHPHPPLPHHHSLCSFRWNSFLCRLFVFGAFNFTSLAIINYCKEIQ